MAEDETTDLVETQIRRRWVLEKRRQGHTVRQIAEMAVDHFGENQLPQSWDAQGRAVSKDIKRALKKSRDELEKIAEDYRELHVNRLQNLLSSIWPYAQEHEEVIWDDDAKTTRTIEKPPDPRIVDRVLAIMDRLAKFHHVEEAPERPSNPGSDETNFFIQVKNELKE